MNNVCTVRKITKKIQKSADYGASIIIELLNHKMHKHIHINRIFPCHAFCLTQSSLFTDLFELADLYIVLVGLNINFKKRKTETRETQDKSTFFS
jgi:hypothetical protein